MIHAGSLLARLPLLLLLFVHVLVTADTEDGSGQETQSSIHPSSSSLTTLQELRRSNLTIEFGRQLNASQKLMDELSFLDDATRRHTIFAPRTFNFSSGGGGGSGFATLVAYIKYHIIPDRRVAMSDLADSDAVLLNTALNDPKFLNLGPDTTQKTILVQEDDGVSIKVDGHTVGLNESESITTKNGIIYLVDSFVPIPGTIEQVARDDGGDSLLSDFVKTATKAGVLGKISNTTAITIFFPQGGFDPGLSKDELADAINYHVFEGTYYGQDMLGVIPVTNLLGDAIELNGQNPDIALLDGVGVVPMDLLIWNGVVHGLTDGLGPYATGDHPSAEGEEKDTTRPKRKGTDIFKNAASHPGRMSGVAIGLAVGGSLVVLLT